MSSEGPQRVGIVVFNGVERLDVEGPMGVLAWAASFARHTISFTIMSTSGAAVVANTRNQCRRTVASLGLKCVKGTDVQPSPQPEWENR